MKNLKYLLFIIPFLFLSNVKADSSSFNVILDNNSSADYFDLYKSSYSDASSILLNLYNGLYEEYLNNYKSLFPYYVIYTTVSTDEVYMSLLMFDDISDVYLSEDKSAYQTFPYDKKLFYRYKAGTYLLPVKEDSSIGLPLTDTENFFFHAYFYSNFDLRTNLTSVDSLVLSFKSHPEMNIVLNNNDIVPTFQSILDLDIIKDPNLSGNGYTEIDLNNYPYVALSLKDYSKTEEFNSMTYVKGQYCLTSVYNYGLTERKDILSGTQMQRCSLYYDNYTPIRTYILKSDLENHSIYYLKAYDTSKENKIKVDTSVFNIHYITEEEKNNPIITINGKKYTPIPYDELTDTATKSEDENYVSGGSCAVGDINCTASLTNGSIKWSDIFTSPLDFLKNIWTSITQVFTLIAYFIALLPITLQYFFYISFTLAIVLGIIKIIL